MENQPIKEKREHKLIKNESKMNPNESNEVINESKMKPNRLIYNHDSFRYCKKEKLKYNTKYTIPFKHKTYKCNKCNKTFVLEKQPKKSTTDYLLKLDCSNMSAGMESWYENPHSKTI